MLCSWSLLSLGASAAPLVPPGATALTGVAVRAERPGHWAVVDLSGRVWRTEDRGERWVAEPVPPLAASSTLPKAGEVAARAVELGDPSGPLAVPLEAEDQEITDLYAEAADLAQAAAEQALDALVTELEAGSWLGEPARPSVPPRVVFLRSGALAVTRGDGVWVGGGQGWARVLGEPATGLCELGGRWVVGTPDGPRSAPAGGGWTPVDPAMGEVAALVCSDEGALAVTSSGLWTSADGIRWERRPGPARGVAASPDGTVSAAEGRLWAGSPPEPVADAPGVVSITRDAAGELLAAGSEGAWASADEGATWSRVRDVPPWPVRAAAADGDAVLLATDHGLWVHRARQTPATPPIAGDLDPEPLVAAVLRADPLPPPRSGRFVGAIPALDLVGTLRRAERTSITSDADEAWWDVAVVLTWTPRRGAAADLAALDDIDVVVGADGEVLIDDGEGRHLLAARVAREASTRRARAARAVLELLAARRVLVREVEAAGGAPLLHRTLTALRLGELDARIDGLTGGATRALPLEEVR